MSENEITPASGPGRGKHDKEGRQRALVDWATIVFAERGYDAATTRDIADRAGSSEGLIHRYFGGKQGLLAAVLQRRGQLRNADLAGDLPTCDTVEEELIGFLDWELERTWRDRDSMRVSVSRSIIDPGLGQVAGGVFHAARAEFLRERLEWHRSQGRVTKDADLRAVCGMISGLAFNAGFFAQVAFQMDRETVHLGAQAIAKVLARGLAA